MRLLGEEVCATDAHFLHVRAADTKASLQLRFTNIQLRISTDKFSMAY
jgi:hypothetical protein